MKLISRNFFQFILIILLLTSCNLPMRPTSSPGVDIAQAGTIVAMTLEALHTPTPTSTIAVQETPIPTRIENSATPTPVLTETVTPTITPTYSIPLLTFDGNTNCREGPGTVYKIVTVLRTGQKVEAIGSQENFWVVRNPNGPGDCWVASEFTIASGSTWALPTMTIPPAPTSAPPAPPTWSNWKYNCTFATGGSTLTMELAWNDNTAQEAGYQVYRQGEMIASLGVDANSYTDITFIEAGKSLSYYIEVFNNSGKSQSSTINASCQ
jgi:hypothetical protein